MSFISWQYALFLVGVVVLYWSLPPRFRVGLLLVGSYFFYGCWDARFLALLLTSTTIDFYCGLAMVNHRVSLPRVLATASLPVLWLFVVSLATHWTSAVPVVGAPSLAAAATFPVIFTLVYEWLWRLPEHRQRRGFLILSIVTNLGVLGFFKYFNFFAASLMALLERAGLVANWTSFHILLPVAISFYTFQSISYAVEIYRGKAEPVRNFFTFAAYLCFFPQLVSGPIERPNDLVPQFVKARSFDISHFHWGVRLILLGLFKKVFIADNCALLANYVFDSRDTLNGYWAVLGVLAFAFQIYGDFSGYTDIARGSARLLGFNLNRNFAFPYFSRGPSEFWQRWHITLSSWFRDYVYIPLGGNRHGPLLTLRNLWITMLLAGLWHGANWTFLLWGAYWAFLLTLYRWLPPLRYLERSENTSVWRPTFAMLLMFVLVLGGWAIFRCQNLNSLLAWAAAFGNWNAQSSLPWVRPAYWLLLHSLPLLAVQIASWKARDEAEFAWLPWPVSGSIYVVLFMAVTSSASSDVEFLYFKF